MKKEEFLRQFERKERLEMPVIRHSYLAQVPPFGGMMVVPAEAGKDRHVVIAFKDHWRSLAPRPSWTQDCGVPVCHSNQLLPVLVVLHSWQSVKMVH